MVALETLKNIEIVWFLGSILNISGLHSLQQKEQESMQQPYWKAAESVQPEQWWPNQL